MVAATEATQKGYAGFNDCETVCIDVPDGQTTFSFKTSDGRCLTACFLPSRPGQSPAFVDIAYHGNLGFQRDNHDERGSCAFEAIAFGKRKRSPGIQWDTREQDFPSSIVCVLMEPQKAR